MRKPLRCAPKLLTVSLLLVATACATRYKPRGLMGDGYSEQRLRSDVWLVNFDASAFTSRERVEAFLLWRCAELTLVNHASYFGVVNENTPVRRTSTRPTLIDHPPYPTDDVPIEPEVASSRSARMTIQIFPERPDNVDRFYEARDILRRLAPKMREQ